jgi:hypothetical protein
MSDVVIRVQNLSKLYRIGRRESYKDLRDTLAQGLIAPFRRISAMTRRRSSDSGDRQPASDNSI